MEINKEMSSRVERFASINYKGYSYCFCSSIEETSEDLRCKLAMWGGFSVLTTLAFGLASSVGVTDEIDKMELEKGFGIFTAIVVIALATIVGTSILERAKAKRNRVYGRKYYATIKEGYTMLDVDKFSGDSCFLDDYDDRTNTVAIVVVEKKGFDSRLETEYETTKTDRDVVEMLSKVVKF